LQKKIKKKISKFVQRYKRFESLCWASILRSIVGISARSLPSAIEGYFNFKTSENFFKIALRKKSFLKEEKSSIEYIQKKFPEIAQIIPQYSYKTAWLGLAFCQICEAMMSTEEESEEYEIAKNFLTLFRKNSSQDKISIDELKHLLNGLELLKTQIGEDVTNKLKLVIEKFLQQNIFFVGLCHGDFHSKNFLQSKGKKYLIDFDCLRKNSLQELDAIYFIVQKIIDDNPGIWWHEAIFIFAEHGTKEQKYYNFLANFLDLKIISQLTAIYFLDRIGQDMKYGSISLPKLAITESILLNKF
jgi:thiamine kinase-like enzyme